jgi:acetyltransferase-like isoleucine patch superfamily enzyme
MTSLKGPEMEAMKQPGKNGGSDAVRFLEQVYATEGKSRSLGQRMRKFRAMLALEISELHFGFVLANYLLAPFPLMIARRLRPAVYRRLGIRIGHGSTAMHAWSMTAMGKPYDRLIVGDYSNLNGTRFYLNAPVRIGSHVTIGEGCLISTDLHAVGPPEERMGHINSWPVTIGDGAWIQRNATVLACNVGAGAVVGTGAIVTKDVPPDTFVAGVPARVIREIPGGDGYPREEETGP